MNPLCSLADLDAGTPMVVRRPPQRSIILMAVDDGLVAFRNACPHAGFELGFSGAALHCEDDQLLKCSVHGALFRRDTGVCVSGPCEGARLKPIELVISGSMVFAPNQSASA